MSTDVEAKPDVILYADSDGQPMSDNTLQFQWIVTLQGNLDLMFAAREDVFVAGDLLWYAELGNPNERAAPDTMVVFGRPKGYRGSYKQWEESDIAPQVVFEVLSPGNRLEEMIRKHDFYEKHGVEEYYIYDPEDNQLTIYQRMDGRFRAILPLRDYKSPRLGIRFDLTGDEMVVHGPDGQRFLTFLEIGQRQRSAELAAAEANARAEQSRREIEAVREKADRLAARLRELGVDPDSLTPPGS
jgi:Uma2 family endonuclease